MDSADVSNPNISIGASSHNIEQKNAKKSQFIALFSLLLVLLLFFLLASMFFFDKIPEQVRNSLQPTHDLIALKLSGVGIKIFNKNKTNKTSHRN